MVRFSYRKKPDGPLNYKLIGFWVGLVLAAMILCTIMIYKLKKFYNNLKLTMAQK